MFQVKSVPIQPFKPVGGRRQNWWSARPSGVGVAGLTNQLISCEGGPSEESSFEDKFRLSVEFWRAWLLPQQRRPPALRELTVMLQLTFRQTADGLRLIPESLYPLLALYTVMREEPRAAAVRRVTVQVMRYHWLLWRPLMTPHEKAIKLPLENIVSDVSDSMYGLEEEHRDEYMRNKPLVDGCHWILPTCLKAVLRNFTCWMGLVAEPRLLTWFGSSLEDLHEGFIV
jgi:hypothetical protein